MMRQKNEFNFIFLEDVQAKMVEIPYKGKELSMFILLPMEVDGLKKVRFLCFFFHYVILPNGANSTKTLRKLIKHDNNENLKRRYCIACRSITFHTEPESYCMLA